MKYRKKPVIVEAYQTDKETDIQTLEGTMHASIGDYIITGVNGEQYPCKPDIFAKTYDICDTAKKQIHADNIRQMSNEELAHLFVQISLWRKPATYNTVDGFCLDNGVIREEEWLEWLKQEVDDEST